MKFVFTGGEPTFNPDFLEFVTYLHDDLLHIIHTTTNGSHTPAYYSKLIQVSDIGFSAHLTYLERPEIYKKFIDNIKSANESRQSNHNASLNWLGVRIMLQPGKLDMAKKLYNDCKEIIPNVNVDLLHGTNKQILPYSQEEIDWVTEANGK
jgi:organic radical activating enzyme